MNLYKMKDNLSVSSYPRTLYSIIISVGLLAVFITFASWILLSYPISTAVGNYVIGINGIVDVSSPASSQSAAPSEVNNVEKLKDRDGAEANQEEGNKGSAEGKPSGGNGNEKLKDRDGVDANREEGNKKNAEENPSAVNDIEKLKDGDGADANREDKNKTSVEEITSEVRNDAKTTSENNWQNPTPSEVNTSGKTTAVINNGSLDADHEGEDAKKANMKPSSVSNTENTTQGFKISQDLHSVVDVGAVDVTKVKQIANDVKTDQPVPEDTKKKYTTENNPPPPLEGECDLFHGEWHYDESGPLYTNNSCPVITQMQNCQGNGRPDKGYENWRWKPSRCELPRFDPHKFLELMKGKTLAFVGDSVARNQMESLLCILWQAEVPKNRGNRHMQRWFFRSKSVMIVRIWSSWLVHQTGAAFKDVPEGVAKVFLDIPDETFMEHIPEFDVVVLSSGHWFAKQSIYIKNNEIVGTQLWSLPNGENFQVNNVEAFGISVDTAMTALATNPNYTGISILRSFSPDHYEGGAWNTGGSCTGKVEPAHPGHLVENGFTNTMHEKQVSGFNRATKKQTNRSKLRLMDITEVFSYRHDGHPGPYRSRDPNKITKRGPDGRPPPQDCLHWCMPGPVDTWNELVLEIIRREYER